MADPAQDVSYDKIKAALELQAEAKPFNPEKPETVPVNLFSGMTKRLEFHDQDPNKMYWWCNDDKGGTTIANAVKSGWRFTERKDVKLNAAVTPRNNALGSQVRQHVGTDDSGGPMYAYLMEMPKELWELQNYGPGSREEYHQKLIEQIHQGTIGEKAGERRYHAGRPFAGTPTGLPPISGDTQIVRPKNR